MVDPKVAPALLSLMAAALIAGGCATAPREASLTSWCVLAVEEEAGTFAILDPQGRLLRRLSVGERPHEVEVAPTGNTAFVSQFGIADYDNRIGTPGDRIVEVDLARGDVTQVFMLPDDVRGPHGVKLRPPDFSELFTNAEVGGDTMLVFDIDSHELLRRFPLPALTHNFVFSADGTALFSFAGANGVSKISATTGEILARRDLGTPVRGLFVTTAGTLLASARGEIAELRASDLSVMRRLSAPRPGQYVYLEQNAKGAIAAPSLNDSGIALFPSDGSPAAFINTGKTPIFSRFGPDGAIYVANVQDDHISVLSSRGEPIARLDGLTSPNGLGFGGCPIRF